MRHIGLAIALSLSTFSAQADTRTYNDGTTLQTACRNGQKLVDDIDDKTVDDAAAGICIGMVTGIQQTLQILDMANVVKKEHQSCWPAQGVNVAQGVRIVNKYLADHPEELHKHDATLVIMALRIAFRCK